MFKRDMWFSTEKKGLESVWVGGLQMQLVWKFNLLAMHELAESFLFKDLDIG